MYPNYMNKPSFMTNTSNASFGASTSFGQPAASTSMFPSIQPPNIFQTPNTSSFSTIPTTQSSFGNMNLFGQQPQPSGLFAGSNAFMANKPSFGFSSTQNQPGIFGQQPQQQAGTSLFQSNSTNLFGSSAFGNQTTGTVIKFAPVTGTDTMQKNGVTQSISTKHHCITCMKEYENKSLEELRFEDYSCNRKGPQQQPGFGGTPFGGSTTGQSTSLFGQTDNKQAGFGQPQAFGQTPSFGQATPAFGATNQTNTSTLFGKPNTFGAATSATPSFGFNAAPSTSNPFSSTQTQKPFSQPLFGTATTQAQPTFGTGGVFGQTNTQNTTTNLFQKPAQPNTGFNTGQPGFSFTQPTTQASNLFQVSKPSTGFGIFGQTNSTPAFGQASQPTFGTSFGKMSQSTFAQPTQPTFGANLAGGLQTQPSLFGNAVNKPPSLFGTSGNTSSLFNYPGPPVTPMPPNSNLPSTMPIFPPEQAEDKNIYVVLNDRFVDGPHTYGLEPVQDEVNPGTVCDLKKVEPAITKKITSLSAGNKIKVAPLKPRRGTNYKKDFFEMNHELKSSPKCLVIRNFENGKGGTTVFNTYGSELLEAAEETLGSNRTSDSVIAIDHSRVGDDYDTFLSPKKPSDPGSGVSHYKGKINKLRLQFDSYTDDSEAKSIEEPPSPIAASSNLEIIESESEPVSPAKKGSTIVPPLDLSEDSPRNDSHDESTDTASRMDSSGSGSVYLGDTLKTDNLLKKPLVCLTKPEYYMYPSQNELDQYLTDNGECIVQGLTIGRKNYGNVHFYDPVNVANMNFDQIVFIRNREVIIYPDEKVKPPPGEGLNRRAQVTLDNIYPKIKSTDKFMTNVDDILRTDFPAKLRAVTQKHGCEFVEYRPMTGSWVFKVKHFSKYAFTASDEEDCAVDDSKDNVKVLDREKEIEEIPKKGLGGGLQLLKNRLISKEAENFVMESTLLDMWPDEPYTLTDELYPTDSTIQNIKSSLFTNLDFSPKESIQERLIAPQQREIRSEVIATPKIHKLSEVSIMMLPRKVTTTQRCYKDFGVFRNNTYKVGWAPGSTFYNNDPSAGSEVIYNITNCKVIMGNSRQYNTMMPKLIKMLDGTFKESEFTFENRIPTLHIKHDLSYLERQTKLFNDHAKDHSLAGQEKYLSSVWNLCSALWGPGDNSFYSRRRSLSDWLKKITFDMSPKLQTIDYTKLSEADIFKTVFKLLSYYKVPEASNFALNNKMSRLSLLISQMSANDRYKDCMQKYINCYTWKEKDIIVDEFKKVYLLLAGVPVHNGINVCDGLDWMRNFGIHLWYIAPAAAPIDVAFNSYKEAFEKAESACKPIPPYCESDSQTTQYDLLYHIIGIYVDSTYQLSNILHPETHTENVIDYRLSWFIFQLFLSLKAGLISDSEKEYLHTTFSTQLENMGHWKWAIVVLLYLKDNVLKKNLIAKILDRNVSAFAETVAIERELVQVFKIPASWIHEVKATKTKAKDCCYDYFQHYIYTRNAQEANKALVEHIIPELFVNEQYDYLAKFTRKLQPFASHLVNWQTEGGLFQDYLELQKSLSEGYDEGPIITGGKLASLLGRVNCFPVKNEQQNLCVSELSKKCALLFKILNKKVEQEEYYAKFIDLFRNLFMTPDIRHNEIFFLATKSLKES